MSYKKETEIGIGIGPLKGYYKKHEMPLRLKPCEHVVKDKDRGSTFIHIHGKENGEIAISKITGDGQ